ncbi:Unknown protein, partial [Striga hermonthica]
ILKHRSLSFKFTTEFRFSAMYCQCLRVWTDMASSPPITTIDKGRPLQLFEIFFPISSNSGGQSFSPKTLFRNNFQLLSSFRNPISRPREPLSSKAKSDSRVVITILLPLLLSGKKNLTLSHARTLHTS